MFHSLYSQIALVALVLCCGFAIWKGGPAERAGALLVAGTWAVTLIASAITRSYMPATAFLASDGVMALGLLVLAVRYSSLWMGAAMLVQAIVLSLHAGYFSAEKADLSQHTLYLYVLGKNLGSVGLLVLILAATTTTVIKRNLARRRQARQAAEAASGERNDLWLSTVAAKEPGAFGGKRSPL